MKITFQKRRGNSAHEILFFWMLRIEGDSSQVISDNFIPELFYDFFCIQQGGVKFFDKVEGIEIALPLQSLKTIHTHGLTLNFTIPLTLFGARFSLKFAEFFWGKSLPSNSFLSETWIAESAKNLKHFAAQVTNTVQKQQTKKTAASLLSPTLEETPWLANFSARHKRRLYKTVFGISRKEMSAIQNVHAFLGQSCDFSTQNPRIIEHINTELFYDQPHLNRTFKKMTGLSPLEHFQAPSILQSNLMAASYNADPSPLV